jgi:hypothetical protein
MTREMPPASSSQSFRDRIGMFFGSARFGGTRVVGVVA